MIEHITVQIILRRGKTVIQEFAGLAIIPLYWSGETFPIVDEINGKQIVAWEYTPVTEERKTK